ncbi:MAG: hypothetical protein QXU87_04175 [Candidatus Caldarchaeum sp.]
MRELFFPELKFYRLHKMARAIHLDAGLRERYRKDPEAVMKEFELTEDEKQLVRSKDPAKMFNAGVSPYAIFFLIWEAEGWVFLPPERQTLYRA